MTSYELVMLIAVFCGPIFAVFVTLFIESRRKSKESKLIIVKMLMTTRHIPSDQMYVAAINLIPIEFHKDRLVMKAYDAYAESVKYEPTEANREVQYNETKAKQTNLIYQVLKNTGFNIPESKLLTDAYVSNGFIIRDNLYLDSLKATCEIAETLKAQALAENLNAST